MIKKPRLQAGQKVLISNPLADFVDDLGELPDDVQLLLESGGRFDFVHLFSSQRTELIQLKTIAVDSIKFDVLLLVSYPKCSSKIDSDLSRDAIWTLYVDAGLRPVSQIPIEKIRSAVCFQLTEKVGVYSVQRPWLRSIWERFSQFVFFSSPILPGEIGDNQENLCEFHRCSHDFG